MKTNIESIKIIINENVVHSGVDEESGEVFDQIVSTVGVKFQADGEQYGTYTVVNKPTLEACDVVNEANAILERFTETLSNALRDDERYIPLVDENLNRVFDSYKKHVVRETLSALKKAVHSKAIFTNARDIPSYIQLKVFDAIVQQYINENTEEKNSSMKQN
jgi:hypothetical protein